MSEQKIKISEFIDNELPKNETIDLLTRIHHQIELDKTLSNYQLISQVIKTGECLMIDSDFSQRISQAIEQQPTVLSPQRKLHNNSFRFAFAVAASIAVVAVIANGVMNAQVSEVRPLLIMTQQQTANKIARLNQTAIIEKKLPKHESVIVEDDDSGFEDYLQAHRGSLYASQAYAQLASNE